jgi:hypothetical protein
LSRSFEWAINTSRRIIRWVCFASLIGVVLVFFICLAYWTAVCRGLSRFSDNRKAAAMTAEFSLALDANTGLCVCPVHVNCFGHITSIR